MQYKINTQFHKNVGFDLSHTELLVAVNNTNNFLCSLPPSLYRSIDFKTSGAMIGAIFANKIVDIIPNAAINPIEKGHPDIIPLSGIHEVEEVLRNYPIGVEIKGTIGNLKNGTNLRAGETRIQALIGITWQAHHREVNHLLGIIWDFVNYFDGFNYPAITGVFFSDQLTPNDWGEISGITGRNTKVTGMVRSGKEKMGEGVILLYDNDMYIDKYSRLMNIPHFR